MIDRSLPRDGWMRVWRGTTIVIGISSLVSLVISEIIMLVLSQGLNAAGAIASLLLPILLGGPIMFWMQLRSVQLSEANHKLEALASTDYLTDCLNRRAFTSKVDAALDGESNALLVIDADHFKTINDRFGHDRGDQVLQQLAEAIRANVRDGDLVGRLGGEEFGVFMHGADNVTAAVVGERIRKAISALFVRSEDMVQRLTVSIGGATCSGELDFTQLFRLADRRLYEAKHQGRNRVLLDDDDPSEFPQAASA